MIEKQGCGPEAGTGDGAARTADKREPATAPTRQEAEETADRKRRRKRRRNTRTAEAGTIETSRSDGQPATRSRKPDGTAKPGQQPGAKPPSTPPPRLPTATTANEARETPEPAQAETEANNGTFKTHATTPKKGPKNESRTTRTAANRTADFSTFPHPSPKKSQKNPKKQ